MAYINWEKTFQFGSFELPTYGNYGGANYSEGTFGAVPNLNPAFPLSSSNPYLSSTELDAINPSANDSFEAVDLLDYSFYVHDVGSRLAGGNTQLQNIADAKLLASLVALSPAKFDPSGEASLYAGFATLG